jgi:neutral ceramidase
VLRRYADGIALAVQSALLTARPGRVLVNAGELADCGANRSLPAFQRNPEAQAEFRAPGQWTDREMLLLALHQDTNNRGGSRPLGALNWFALHPTSLGMYNTMISGDSKGRAEELMEAGLAGPAPGFVAAFGNGNAGDVSGNLTLDARGNATVRIPEGGEADDPVRLRTASALLPAVRNRSQAGDLARLEQLAQRQADHARGLFDAASVELHGPIRARRQWVDFSQVALPDGRRTWPAALGVSFGAGSSEDSYAVASLGVDLDPGIVEGITHVEMAAGATVAAGLLGLLAPGVLAALATGSALTPTGLAGLAGQLTAALPVLAASPTARAFVFGGIGALALPGQLDEQTPGRAGANPRDYTWQVPGPLQLPMDVVVGHGAKPIMFPVGLTRLLKQGGTATPWPVSSDRWSSALGAGEFACPVVPQVLPVQLLMIGSVALVGVPAEFTSTAGRRIKARIRTALGPAVTHVAVSNYTNGYAGYVTTAEEYQAQHYEGASTLYGPHTLAAYELVVDGLAAAARDDVEVRAASAVPSAVPFEVPAVHLA